MKLYFDGSFFNKLKAYFGWVLKTDYDMMIASGFGKIDFCSNSNCAEFHALLEGLKYVNLHKYTHLMIYGDSQYVFYHLNRNKRISKYYRDECLFLLKDIRWEIKQIKRIDNKDAHNLTKHWRKQNVR